MRSKALCCAAMFFFVSVAVGMTTRGDSASARTNRAASPIAVLRLAPMAVDEYSVAPKADDLAALTTEVRAGLASPSLHLALLPESRLTTGACADVACARRIGRELGARTVVFGTVVRLAGIRWNAQVSAIRVDSGGLLDTLTYGVLGDYDSLLNSVREAGVCLGRSISGGTRCKPNPPAI